MVGFYCQQLPRKKRARPTLAGISSSSMCAVIYLAARKILDALRYSKLYRIAVKLWTCPLLTTLATRSYTDGDWEVTAAPDGFVNYDRTIEDVLSIRE